MTAYFVAIRKALSDPGMMEEYSRLASVAREGHPLTPLAAYGRIEPLEGDTPDGGVILAFPSFAEAEAWYHSAAYQTALAQRLKASEYQTFIIEGLDASADSAAPG